MYFQVSLSLVPYLLNMPRSTSQAIHCSYPAEFERAEFIRDDSGLLRPDGSESESSVTPQGQDEHQAYQASISHRTSLESGIEGSTNEHQSEALKGVPRSLYFSWSSLAADAISILVTVPFIILGSLLAQANDKAVDRNVLHNFENGIRVVSTSEFEISLEKVADQMSQAATALPFVFAAIFGRLSAQVARWKLERGGSLPSIEQWLGSRTLFSAFLTQFKLGGLNVIGVSMTIAWALSPLGAQSILRVIGTDSRDVETNGSVAYFDTNTESGFTTYGSTYFVSGGQDVTAVINSMYAASLMSADSIKSSGQDLWGNIKVPYLQYTDSSSGDAWVTVPDDGSIEFSSLVGLPLATNINPVLGLKSNFTMESSHIQLECSPFVTTAALDNGYLDLDAVRSYENSSLDRTCEGPEITKIPKNGTFQALTSSAVDNYIFPWILALDTFVDQLWVDRLCHPSYRRMPGNSFGNSPATFAQNTTISTSQAKLQLLAWDQSIDTPESDPVSTTCAVSQSWVESRVDCDWSTSPSCAVTAQRPSQKQHASSNITHLSFPNIFTSFSAGLPGASGLTYLLGLGDASLIYLANTSTSYISSLEGRSASLENVTTGDTSYRLGQLINTYLMISQAYSSISAGSLGKDSYESHILNVTTTMRITKSETIYTINAVWLAAFFVTAIAMLIGSILGAIFCHSSITPEILGFASAAIRDSKYVDLAPGFGALGGLEMTKAFEKIEFRYGVVKKTETGEEVLGVSWKVSAERVKKRVPYV